MEQIFLDTSTWRTTRDVGTVSRNWLSCPNCGTPTMLVSVLKNAWHVEEKETGGSGLSWEAQTNRTQGHTLLNDALELVKDIWSARTDCSGRSWESPSCWSVCRGIHGTWSNLLLLVLLCAGKVTSSVFFKWNYSITFWYWLHKYCGYSAVFL